MIEVGIFSALLGGLLTFFAPCTFPLIPAYIGFLAGAAGQNGRKLSQRELQRHIVSNAFLFVLGFTLVFVLFGLISGVIGTFLILHRMLITQIGGVVVIFFGLYLLGLIRIPALFKGNSFPSYLTPGRPLSAFLLGLFFGFGWSPCLGPILGTILLLAGTAGTASYGAFLLLCYSFGLALPFLLVAFIYGTAFSYVLALQKYLKTIEKIAGVFLVLVGVMLVVGKFGMFNVWADELLSSGWYGRLMDLM